MESIHDEEIIYRKLQEHMNLMPVGFPKNETGADIRVLKHFFTPDEARVALELSLLPETLERIYPRIKDLGYSREQAEEKLDTMVKKGILRGGELLPATNGKKKYSIEQWVIGIFEFNVNKLKKESLPDIAVYSMTTFKNEFFKKGTPVQMRTIPIGKSIKRESVTATYDDIRKVISNAVDPIVIINCVCREFMDKMSAPCKKSEERETCISLGIMAKHALSSGIGRIVSKDEVFSILNRFEEIGFVLQPENNQDPQFICCCCGCCCGVLMMAKQFPKPTEYFSSNYYAVVDSEKCNGAGTCMHRCQMGAIIVKDGKAKVNLDRCIGCGLCTSTCQTGALELIKRDKETIPPKDHDDLYRKIRMKKLGPVKNTALMMKHILGFKI